MNHKLDFAAASEAAGVGRLEVGKPEELAEVLGYPRNGVSPLGIPGEVPVLIDAELHNFPTILIGGGATGIEIEIAPDTLAHLTGAVVVSLSALP
ncbi:hypothetical protein AVW09_00695 [Microbacterium sp. T32]|nr:hypothetical protein AVW09_00695 [Microbacterium sp. T32]